MKEALSFFACGLLLLSGCAPTASDLPEKSVVLAKRMAISQDRTIGQSASVVRTFTKDATGKSVEVRNAICDVRSDELSGRVTSPQRIVYPVFIQAARFKNRGKPGNLVVSCKASGKAGTVVLEPGPGNLAGRTNTTTDSNGVTVSMVPLLRSISSSYPWVYQGAIRVELE